MNVVLRLKQGLELVGLSTLLCTLMKTALSVVGTLDLVFTVGGLLTSKSIWEQNRKMRLIDSCATQTLVAEHSIPGLGTHLFAIVTRTIRTCVW